MSPDDDGEVIEVRPGDELDWAALERHLRAHLDLPGESMRVTQFTAGRANLTYLLSFGGDELVLRRPPMGTIAPGAHDMAREGKVLSRLHAAYPRALRVRSWSRATTRSSAPRSWCSSAGREWSSGTRSLDRWPTSSTSLVVWTSPWSTRRLTSTSSTRTRSTCRILGRPDGFGSAPGPGLG